MMPAGNVVNEKQQRAQMITALAVTGIIVALVFAVPLALGSGLWWVLRNKLAQREWIVVLVASIVATVLTFNVTVSTYVAWVQALVFGEGNRLAVPWLSVLALTGIVAGVAGIAANTSVGARIKQRIHPLSDDIIPDEREIRKLSQVVVPDSDMTVSTYDHSLVTGGETGERSFPLGLDRHGKPVLMSESELKTHAVVLGSTGSGKTETLKNLAGNLMDLGWQVVVVDLKEDTQKDGLRDFCRDYAYGHALHYQELAISEPQPRFWFNPLYGMTPDESINAILSLQEFDDGYWQAINRTTIGQIVTLFYDAHRIDPERFPAPTMYDIGNMLRQPDLRTATKEMRKEVLLHIPGRTEANFTALGKPSDDERKSASGLGARIINMYESDAGRKVLRGAEGREVMDVTLNGVCYIGLNTLGLSELARVVSTSVLLRLATLAGARTTGAVEKASSRIAVIIDEANWIDRKNVQNLLSRCRSAGISVILATQGANDWNDENGQDWEKIVNNVNVGIIMRQGGLESAELCADFIGKRQKQSLVTQVLEGAETGMASVREIEDYIAGPEQLRNLMVGQAILRIGTPQQRITWTKVVQRRPEMGAGGSHMNIMATAQQAPPPAATGPYHGPMTGNLPGGGRYFPPTTHRPTGNPTTPGIPNEPASPAPGAPDAGRVGEPAVPSVPTPSPWPQDQQKPSDDGWHEL